MSNKRPRRAPTAPAALQPPRAPTGPQAPADPLAHLAALGDALADVGRALHLAPAHMAEREAFDRLEITTALSIADLATLDPDLLATHLALFAGDLTLDLRLEGLDPDATPVEAALRANRDPAAALRRFSASARQAAATQGDDIIVTARLAAAKTRALALARAIAAQQPDYAGTPAMQARTTVAVFYTAAAWERLTTLAAVPLWEDAGLASAEGRACVILCDAPGHLAGVALDILGAVDVPDGGPDWLTITRALWQRFVARAAEMRALDAEESTWPHAPRALTPEHLRLRPRRPGLEATAARLVRLRACLAAAYLATTVQGSLTDGPILRFSGPRPAACHLPARGDTPDAREAANEPAADTDGTLVRLAAWAYQSGSGDKLAIARECLARELPAGGEVTLAQVERAAIPAFEAARANFVLYVRSHIEQYFTARQAAQAAVADYAQTVRTAVADLTADVVDNVYRTAGLLVGVVVAGLLEPPALPPVTVLAAILYTVYIAFVLAFLMRARHDRYTLEAAALRERLAAMPELTETERARLQAPAHQAEAHFTRYFRQALIIYGVMLLAGILATIILATHPNLLHAE